MPQPILRNLALAAMAATSSLSAAPAIKATIQADRPGHEVPRTLYGVFFEDINGAADGGLYPELVANRGFDWAGKELGAWAKDFRGGGVARISRQSGFPLHPSTATYLRVEVYHPGKDLGVGVSNPGFGGISVKQGAAYRLSFYARPHANYKGGLRARLEGKDGVALGEFRLEAKDWRNQQPATEGASPLDPVALADWVKYEAEIVPSADAMDARLCLLLDAAGTMDLEFVSLFPKDTWGNRPNGLRKDLVQKLKDMKPGALRFPGGCIVEGVDLDNLYDWKRTVGPIERRPPNWNLWGYWQSHGLGYFEYFQLAEDIGAEALPVLAAGMSCQFRKSEMPPLDGLQEFIQSALDLIEFANGAADTPWGKVRADMGRPEPFGIKYIGIGNENWGREFIDRYAVIAKAVKAKHPEILIVSSSGAGPAGPEYELAWREIPAIGADLIDEHYYVSQEWLYQSNKRYDKFDRNGPKVYVGEYACHLPGRPNNLDAALAEAHMMTGFERNSDVVVMTSYAPLFNKIGNTQWVPDLIWFDNARSFGTPSYHVQAMFGNHLPDKILPAAVQRGTLAAAAGRAYRHPDLAVVGRVPRHQGHGPGRRGLVRGGSRQGTGRLEQAGAREMGSGGRRVPANRSRRGTNHHLHRRHGLAGLHGDAQGAQDRRGRRVHRAGARPGQPLRPCQFRRMEQHLAWHRAQRAESPRAKARLH